MPSFNGVEYATWEARNAAENNYKAHIANNVPAQNNSTPAAFWADTAQANPDSSNDIVTRDQNEIRYYKPGSTVPYRVDRAPAGGGSTGQVAQNSSGNISAAMTADMRNAMTSSMNSAATGAYNQSIATGFIMKPIFDKDGNWAFDYELDSSGQRIPTMQSQMTRAQIEDMAARRALEAQVAAGIVKDPSTGQWIKTPDAVRLDLQSKLNDAQIKAIDADIALNKDKLASANAQFDKDLAFRTQQHLDKLALDRQAQQNQNDQFNITASGYMASGANTLDRDKMIQDQLQFDQNLDFQKAVELANAVSDPTRLVQGASLANIWGGAKGGTIMAGPGQVGITDPGFDSNASQTRSIAAQSDQDIPGAFGTGLNGAVEQAQNLVNQASATNPLISVAPEINKTLSGGVTPAFGNPTGVSGSIQPLNTITPSSGDFSKIIPAAFMALSDTGQKQYAALAQARQPGLKPADLVKNIRAQVPGAGSGFVPAAFMTR